MFKVYANNNDFVLGILVFSLSVCSTLSLLVLNLANLAIESENAKIYAC